MAEAGVDQIFDRFGNLLKSLFSEDSPSQPGGTSFSDPDLQDAWDELEDFLHDDNGSKTTSRSSFTSRVRTPEPEIPVQLQQDYKLLNSKPGTPLTEVAKSYRQLLRIHHPDKHAADPEAFAKATEKTKSLTAAFRRIKEYTDTGKIS